MMFGIENGFNLGCYHISLYLVIQRWFSIVKNNYNPSNNILKIYTHVIWKLISCFLLGPLLFKINNSSYNITYQPMDSYLYFKADDKIYQQREITFNCQQREINLEI